MENAAEVLMFYKYRYWKEGISTKQFFKENRTDIMDVIDIDNAIHNKHKREAEVRKLLNNVSF